MNVIWVLRQKRAFLYKRKKSVWSKWVNQQSHRNKWIDIHIHRAWPDAYSSSQRINKVKTQIWRDYNAHIRQKNIWIHKQHGFASIITVFILKWCRLCGNLPRKKQIEGLFLPVFCVFSSTFNDVLIDICFQQLLTAVMSVQRLFSVIK